MAALIDLEGWGEVWEDFYDIIVSQSRQDEPTIPWEDLKKKYHMRSHRKYE